MDRGGGGSAQTAMPQTHEVHAARVAFLGGGKYLFRLHVEEAQPHRAISHDSFQVSPPTASAVGLLGIERHHHVSALPHSRRVGIASESDPVANGPNPYQ